MKLWFTGVLAGIGIIVVMVAGMLIMTRTETEAGVTSLARLRDANGVEVGTVKLQYGGAGRVQVRAYVHGMTPGYHGFHIHAVGMCDPTAFTTAGGHFNPAGSNHPDHAGDLSPILVNASGEGWSETMTTRFALGALADADGSAFIVHGGPDNFANIPSRYAPPADAATLGTGDSGARIACAVIADPQ